MINGFLALKVSFDTAKAGWRCRPCRDAVPPSRCLFHYYVSVWQEWRGSECIHVQFHFEEVYVLFSLRSSQKMSIRGKGNTSDLPSSHFLTSPLMTGVSSGIRVGVCIESSTTASEKLLSVFFLKSLCELRSLLYNRSILQMIYLENTKVRCFRKRGSDCPPV